MPVQQNLSEVDVILVLRFWYSYQVHKKGRDFERYYSWCNDWTIIERGLAFTYEYWIERAAGNW